MSNRPGRLIQRSNKPNYVWVFDGEQWVEVFVPEPRQWAEYQRRLADQESDRG